MAPCLIKSCSLYPTCLLTFPARLPPRKPVLVIHFQKPHSPHCWAQGHNVAACGCAET